MKFRGKEVKVILSKEAKQQYDELKLLVSKEQKEGVKSSFNQQLLKSIDNKIEYLKMIPFNLVQKYGINNLWIIDLVGYWRILYTLKTSEVEIISLILEWMDHDKYNKTFGRKKK